MYYLTYRTLTRKRITKELKFVNIVIETTLLLNNEQHVFC